MEPYYIIFLNSLKSSIIVSMYSENAWFAALQFGGYDIWFATIAAVCGSSIGTLLNFGAGYYMAGKRSDWFVFKESLYNRIVSYNRYTMFILMVPFSAIPMVGSFFNIYVLVAGFFRISPAKAALLIISGRTFYYLLCIYGLNAPPATGEFN